MLARTAARLQRWLQEISAGARSTTCDPDERDSLDHVARGVGAGLDALASPDGDVLNVLTALNASIGDGFAKLAAKIDTLRAGETNADPA